MDDEQARRIQQYSLEDYAVTKGPEYWTILWIIVVIGCMVGLIGWLVNPF